LGDELIRSQDVKSIAMSNVHTIDFPARRVSLADPKHYDVERRAYSEGAWKPIIFDQPRMLLQSESAPSLPSVRIQPDTARTLSLDPVRVKAHSHVVLESPGPACASSLSVSESEDAASRDSVELKATIEPKEGIFNIVASGRVQIQTRELNTAASGFLSPNQPATFAVEFDDANPTIRIMPRPGPVDLVFVPVSDLDLTRSLLPTDSLKLSHPNFLCSVPNASPQNNAGSALYVSSLLADANNRVSYTDYPERKAQFLAKHAILHVSDDVVLTLADLSVSRSTGGIHIELRGRPSFIYSMSAATGRVDYQMNCLDYLMESRHTRLFAIGAWLASTTFAAYKVLKELRKDTDL
jgi:hypothetical protein